MITIPTTELIGCIADVLPVIQDPKHCATGGVVISWDGDALRFAAYDTNSGAEVTWVPGEGAERDDSTGDGEDEIVWGGTDDPWRVFVWYADAKEIVKLFTLPAKLWRFPVRIKVNVAQTKLTIERDDMARGQRLLVVSTYNDMLRHIPDIPSVARRQVAWLEASHISLNGARVAAIGACRPHGALALQFGADDEPVCVTVGSRLIGFVYRSGIKPRPYNILRGGSGLVTSS